MPPIDRSSRSASDERSLLIHGEVVLRVLECNQPLRFASGQGRPGRGIVSNIPA